MDIVNRNEPALASGAFLFDAPALAVTVYCRHRLAAPCGKSLANAIRGWCCGGARGRDRTLRLSVIRLRPRALMWKLPLTYVKSGAPCARSPIPQRKGSSDPT